VFALRRIVGPIVALAFGLPALCQDTGVATNVALGKSFTSSSPGGIAWQGLLDGEKSSDSPPGCFATGPDAEYPKKIVIDLGAVYLIEQVIVHSAGNGNTKSVDVWASRDGVNYQQLRKPYVFPDKTSQRMSARFQPQEARYVKLALWDTYGGGLGGDHILYLREVEVMGREVAATSQTRARPELPEDAPRLVRIFRRYVLGEGKPIRLLVIGDDMAIGRGEGKGLSVVLAEKLGERFSLDSIEVDDETKAGLTARSAASLSLEEEDKPDLVLVALGAADALAFDPATFRAAMGRLLDKLLTRTEALIVVVAPPDIPHSAELGRAEECASADTADPAWQIASLIPGRGIAVVDGNGAIKDSGLPVAEAYADNLSLTDSGHEVIATAVVKLLRQ
jgi:lysophospholipase L1-like esterase